MLPNMLKIVRNQRIFVQSNNYRKRPIDPGSDQVRNIVIDKFQHLVRPRIHRYASIIKL